MRRALAICLICIAPAIVGCGSSKTKTDTDIPSGGAGQSANTPAPTAPTKSAKGCRKVSAPKPKGPGHEKKPKGSLDASKKWSLVVETNCGAFTIALDLDNAPNTSASLVALAKSHFYDGTTFHRIVPGFVVQGGDPTGTGDGGPGYSTVDKPPAQTTYSRGVVAMAKTEQEPPGTAGSQFFVVTGQDAGLPPDYAVVGRVIAGLDVVERIGELGDPNTEKPTQTVEIEHVTAKQG